MFTIEIKINGSMIGHIYGVNRGQDGDLTKYDYEYYEPETRGLTKGRVLYDRDNGIRPLISAILSDIDKASNKAKS